MRILQLDLTAYGPFTKRSLEFRDQTGLHIVYGPNEAGKTSSLRALKDLLYGIPQQTPDDFIHPYTKLRIGGLLEAADGVKLQFIRRKGRTKTLRGPDDVAVFDESKLQMLLRGVDADTFSLRYGINFEELRRGGDAVVRGAGELANILFAAGSGLADMRAIQGDLNTEAETLFKPRGSAQLITAALTELNQKQKEIREAQLPTSQWVDRERLLRKAESRQAEIDIKLSQIRAEKSRLQRIHDSLPLIGQRKPLQEKLIKIGDAALLPDTFQGDRREAEASLADSKRAEASASLEIKQLQEQLSQTEVPDDLLQHRAAIIKGQSDLVIYKKAAKDLPGIVADHGAIQQQALKLVEDLGRPMKMEEAASLRISKIQRRQIQELASDCQVFLEKQKANEISLQKVEQELRQVKEEIDQVPPVADASELERVIRRVLSYGAIDTQIETAQSDAQILQLQISNELSQLPGFTGDVEALERLPVPPAETIERFERELTSASEDVRRWENRIDELHSKIKELKQELDELHLEGEVPTEADLEEARHKRDAGWKWTQQRLSGEQVETDSQLAEFFKEFAPEGDLVNAFERSIVHADMLADRLRREADRVARKAGNIARLNQYEVELEHARKSFERHQSAQTKVEVEWRSLWQTIEVAPLPPREMRAWREQQQKLINRVAELRKNETTLESLGRQSDLLREELNRCLQEIEKPTLDKGEPLSLSVDRCQQIVDMIQHNNRRMEGLLEDQKKLITGQKEAQESVEKAQESLDQWRIDWVAAIANIGLKSDVKPPEAIMVIETMDEVISSLDKAREFEKRISDINQDADVFKQSIRELIQKIAPEMLPSLENSVEQVVHTLVDQLSRAETNQTRVQSWNEQLLKQQSALEEAKGLIAHWSTKLEELCALAGCHAMDELTQAEERSRLRRETESQLNTLDQQLTGLAAPTSLEEWITEAEEYNPDQVQADLIAMNESITLFEQEKQENSEGIGEHRNELTRMNGNADAAEAQLQAELLTASIRSDAEEYIRVRLASVILTRAMERFREESQGPILTHASKLFASLSCGSFAGLRVDYDSNGNALVVGVRPDDQAVHVEGMSDGTCDQLYLSLRLALFERSLEGQEPLPFIVDDILINFDDDRSQMALDALSQLAKKTQVIFFTHHEHLVDIARSALDQESVDIIRL
ncbi:hypothetical protein Pla110_41140 [Polystyrenella longa]|uniref:YhaN AAA domain-containing protein n=1 Tax=Polystyrenella longa TaxID=2528007 RepID=A0A518CT04_9PLAN|nr:YhaN family protein [Polystyrenella longa]QDU82359.1 hypothetical protein Pla110_41140 [Polystyrenella longa]